MVHKFYRINQNIRAEKVRVIGQDGKQVGVLPLNEAQTQAREQGLDLVEIAPTANPPVVKIVDFKKFLYQEEKRERETKKKTKGGELKGIRLTPFIAQADLEVRIRRAEKFLKKGNKARISVRFMGRQLGKKEFGYQVLKKATEALSGCSQAEGEAKWFGRDLVLTLAPAKQQGEKDGQEQKNEDQEVSHPEVQTNPNG